MLKRWRIFLRIVVFDHFLKNIRRIEFDRNKIRLELKARSKIVMRLWKLWRNVFLSRKIRVKTSTLRSIQILTIETSWIIKLFYSDKFEMSIQKVLKNYSLTKIYRRSKSTRAYEILWSSSNMNVFQSDNQRRTRSVNQIWWILSKSLSIHHQNLSRESLHDLLNSQTRRRFSRARRRSLQTRLQSLQILLRTLQRHSRRTLHNLINLLSRRRILRKI